MIRTVHLRNSLRAPPPQTLCYRRWIWCPGLHRNSALKLNLAPSTPPYVIITTCRKASARPKMQCIQTISQFSFSTNPKPPSANERRENILTVPNILTTLRIAFTPAIGYFIVTNNFPMAVGALAIASFTDFVDGWIARTFDMKTVLGSVLDPAADKFLMTTLVVTLSIADLLPVPLAVLILGRDIALIMASIYVRYITLPPPKTWRRYWDVSLPTAEVHSPFISKVNTALQLALMAASITAPMFDLTHFWAMDALRLTVGVTTIWSGLSMFSKGVVTRVR